MKKTADTIIAAAHADAAARYPGDTDAQARDRLAFACGVLQGELRGVCAELERFAPEKDAIEARLGLEAVWLRVEHDEHEGPAITAALMNGSDVWPFLSLSAQAFLEAQLSSHFEDEGRKAAEDEESERAEYRRAA